MKRKSRVDCNPLVSPLTVPRVFVAPWPAWEHSYTDKKSRFYNLSSQTSNGLEYLAREFNEALYVIRLEYSVETMPSIFYAIVIYLQYLEHIPRCEWPNSIADVSFKSLMQFVTRMSGMGQSRPFTHNMSNATLVDHARYVRRVVDRAWRSGVVLGRRPALTGNFPSYPRGNRANTETVYSDEERRRIANAVRRQIERGRGTDFKDERKYLAACCCIFFMFFPVNKADVTRLREDSLVQAEKERLLDQIVFEKRRPKKKASRQPVARGNEYLGDGAFAVRQAKHLVRRVFQENRAANKSFFTAQAATGLLFTCLFPRKGEGEMARGCLTGEVLDDGLRLLEAEHSLQNDDGTPLRLTPRRLRKTYLNKLPASESIETKAEVMNHVGPETTVESYVVLSDEAHYRFHLGMKVLSAAVSGVAERIVLAANAAGISPEVVRRLSAGMLRTKAACCTDPVDGKYAPKNGSPCRRTFTCFHCPNLAVMTSDLYRLASLKRRITLDIDAGRLVGESKIFFASIREVISKDIFPLFELRHIRKAEKDAVSKLHPLWSRPDLEAIA